MGLVKFIDDTCKIHLENATHVKVMSIYHFMHMFTFVSHRVQNALWEGRWGLDSQIMPLR